MGNPPFKLPVNDLRISVTSKCNLECIYCHREGKNSQQTAKQAMTVEEIGLLVDIAGNFGVRAVKITGGEPLVREDILEITRIVAAKPHIEDLSIVTNGILLQRYARGLKDSGVDRINVSLDTLDPEVYTFLSKGILKPVLDGIAFAASLGFNLIKLNLLVLKGINEDSVQRITEYIRSLVSTSPTPIHLQLIELVRTNSVDGKFFDKHFVDLRQNYREWLLKRSVSSYFRKKNRRECFVMPEGFVVELVTPTHNTDFCEHCSRIRITADGFLKPCLMREDNLVDIIGPVRNGASRRELEAIFQKAISLKAPYWLEHLDEDAHGQQGCR
ncbi:MAG: GTP 3',8-cyclase MoaA [Candidatus Odinarchaeota archaeon]